MSLNPRSETQPLRWLLVAVVCGTLASLVRGESAPAANPPNIVFILADDLGYGDVSALNPQNKIKTPQLDRLAAQGMSFTEAHSTSAVCTPSRYSILTGRYNWRSSLKSGVLGGFGKPLIEPGRMTVAGLLKRQGYHTACFGKWHLGFDWPKKSAPGGEAETNETMRIDFTQRLGRGPTTLGFDYFFGISASLDMPPYTFIENDRVTELPTVPAGRLIGADGKPTNVGPLAPGFDASEVLPTLTRKAVGYIGQQAQGDRAKQPFFLYLALPSPHTPIVPSKAWLGKSGLGVYADFVMQTDDSIGEILTALENSGVASNTLVMVTSDNGFAPMAGLPELLAQGHDPNAGRRGQKADIYDGGHHEPLIVRWPGHVGAGSKSDRFVSLIDLMATCADLLNVKLPAEAGEDSISFLPVLLGQTNVNTREVLVESSNNGSFAIREAQWKLALCPDSGGWSYPRPGSKDAANLPRFQLFDLQTDPAEKTNVISARPEVVQRLGRLMRDYLRNGRSTPGAPQPNAAVKAWPQSQWLEQFADGK